MTITNHILVGSLIGLAVTNPILAVVLALVSHFVMDALPLTLGMQAEKVIPKL